MCFLVDLFFLSITVVSSASVSTAETTHAQRERGTTGERESVVHRISSHDGARNQKRDEEKEKGWREGRVRKKRRTTRR